MMSFKQERIRKHIQNNFGPILAMVKTRDAHKRHAEYYLECLEAIENEFLESSYSPRLALEKYDLEAQQIIRAQESVYQLGMANLADGDLCLDFVIKGILLIKLRQSPSIRIKHLELALKYAQSQKLSQHILALYNLLGVAYQEAGNLTRSIEVHEEGLSNVNLADDSLQKLATGVYIGNLGGSYTKLSKYNKAENYFRKALEISHDFGDRRDELSDLCNLGSVLAEQGKNSEALESYQFALSIADEIRDIEAKALILSNLGQFYGQNSDPKSIPYLLEAKQIFEKHFKNHPDFPVLLMNLGNAYSDAQDYLLATEYYQQARKLCQETEDLYSQSLILTSLGNVHSNLLEYEMALEYHLQGLRVSEVNGYFKNASICLGNIGNIYYKTERYTEAIKYYEQAIRLNPRGNEWNLHIWFNNLARASAKLGDTKKALGHFLSAIEIATKLGLAVDKTEYQIALCNALLEKKEFVAVLPHLLDLLSSVPPEDHSLTYSILNQIIRVNMLLGKASDTIEYRKQTIEIAKKNFGNEDIVYQLGELGNIYNSLELHLEALNCYTELLSWNPNESARALTLANIGSTQYLQKEYQAAKNSYQLALQMFDKIKDTEHSSETKQIISYLDSISAAEMNKPNHG